MVGRYKHCSELYPSGVEWLGNIPKAWQVKRLKHLAKIRNGQDYKNVEAEEGIPVYGSGGPFTFASTYMYDKASVLLGRKGTIDKPLFVDHPFWTVDTMYYTEVDEETPAKFLYYLATTIQFGRYATNTALPSMTQEHLSNYSFATPTNKAEQTKIAAFLDYETAKIDALIAKQERLIALLEEKRQAVISHAVTKGLNPDAPLRPSGIDWLGDVPAHWNVKKVSWGFKATKGKNGQLLTKEYCGEHSGPFPVYSGQTENQGVLGRISWYEFDFGSDGTLFATTVGAKAMHLSYLSGKLSLSQNCMLITPTDAELLTRFYYYHFQPLFKYERSLIPDHMQASFRMEDLYQYQHAVPPPKEQQAITEYLDAKIEKFADLVAKAQSAITLLKERRTALISAAVTGKIDVRDWQPPKDITDQDTAQEAFA